MSLLEAHNVGRCFRHGSRAEVWAVRDVSLAIAQGCFCVLSGPSGSGKTTLLALLGALDRPTTGHVLIDGHDLATCSDVELARVRRRMGFVFQSFALIPRLPVWQNVTYPLIPRGLSWPKRYEVARSLLSRFGLADKLSNGPEELSAGEQQRVAMARALAGQPEMLVADEPTSNLDRATAGAVTALLGEFHRSGKTVLVSTHDSELVSLATIVYKLESGRLESAPQETAPKERALS